MMDFAFQASQLRHKFSESCQFYNAISLCAIKHVLLLRQTINCS